MAKKALLLGVNTIGLKYCDRDVDLMNECLQKYGYTAISPSNDKYELLKTFDNLISNCEKTDTLILFFSGHGIVERNKLYFLLGSETSDEASKININQCVESLSGCRAENKLLILDCCNAGTGLADWNLDISDRYRILTASERIEKSKEIDELRASFLTHSLYRALSNPPAEIIDSGGKIRIQELGVWLIRQAQKHNSAVNAIQVPIPNLLGNLKANFEIATALPPICPAHQDLDLSRYEYSGNR